MADTDLINALKLALPYVEKVANTQPTEMERVRRQRQAVKDVAAIRAILNAKEA